MLRHLAMTLRACVKLVCGFLWLPFDILGRLGRMLGFGPPEVPTVAPSGPTPEDVLARLDGRPETPVPDYAPGAVAHAYAAAPAHDRATVDLAPLTAAQVSWLLSLSDADLDRLAKAGPKACDRAANGKRSGVVGLTPCRRGEPQRDARKADREPAADYVLAPSFKMAA